MRSQTLQIPKLSLRLMPQALLFAVLLAPPAMMYAAQDRQPAAQKAPQEKGPSAQQEFQALLERVKKSDSTVDFGRMRQLQTQLDDYDPYASKIEEHPFEVLAKGDLQKAKTLAEAILAENYLNLEAHIAAAAVAEKNGDAAGAAHHRYVVKGVLDSILGSGDGKTPQTAFQVIALSEEYAVMRRLGLRVAEQSLIHAGEHSYDLLKGVDPQSQTQREVFFNIDPIMKALDKELSH